MLVAPKGLKRRDFVVCSSQLGRLEQCPASGIYERAAKRRTNYGQWHGIFVHRFLEYTFTKGVAAALAYVRSKNMPKVIRCCEGIDLDALPKGIAELGWAHNPATDTSRQLANHCRLRSNMDFSTEQFGRADLVAYDGRDRATLDGIDRPLVIDYKSGLDTADADPGGNTQLLGLAASLRCELKCDKIDVALVGVQGTGRLDWVIATLTNDHLDAYVSRARRVQLRVVADRQRADEGIAPYFAPDPEHCRWCQCKPVCPALA